MPIKSPDNVDSAACRSSVPVSLIVEGPARRLARWVTGLLLFFLMPGVTVSAPDSVAVLYPDVPDPYQAIFREIISGIKARMPTGVHNYVLDNGFDVKHIRTWLTERDVNVIIALGRRGLNAATAATDSMPIISGALLLTPRDEKSNVVGISLAPDPKLLFARLRALDPGIKRIQTVYDPEQNAWIMDLAVKEAAALNLTLVTHKASSLREAVYDYKKILFEADPHRDALWLPVDNTTMNDQVVLPLILRESWERGLVVFSSNPAHASEGVLFSVFPDNKALGANLARLARKVAAGDSMPAIHPLDKLLFAVNERTADHLGLAMSAQWRRRFKYVFPSQ